MAAELFHSEIQTDRQTDIYLSHDPVVPWPLKMGTTDCSETSVINYHYWLRNNPEEPQFSTSFSLTLCSGCQWILPVHHRTIKLKTGCENPQIPIWHFGRQQMTDCPVVPPLQILKYRITKGRKPLLAFNFASFTGRIVLWKLYLATFKT